MGPEQLFLTVLRTEALTDRLLGRLATADVCALRQASSACCNLVSKRLFARIRVSFGAASFTRPARVAALARVGHLVEHLSFAVPHSAATELPPLVDPASGREVGFLYVPCTSVAAAAARPKYASAELGELLTRQFPPLFHAATNVPSFIHALALMPNVCHLTVRCPGQDPRRRYRRDIVDYALISLRIAVERAPLTRLATLSLSPVHPAAFNYLRHVPGVGCVPSAARRWRQIRKLHVSVEAWDFYGPAPGLDHLKLIDDYIRSFAPSFQTLSFAWIGARGPCLVALAADPLFAPLRACRKLFHEVTSPMSLLPSAPARAPIHFLALRRLAIRNAAMNAPQLSGLIYAHRETVCEFDFGNVVLANRSSWDEALAPLSRDSWSCTSRVAPPSSDSTVVANDGWDGLPSPSAAVEAASKELLDADLGGFGFGQDERDVMEGLSEVAAARDEVLSITTTLKKKRRRRRRKHTDKDDGAADAHPATSAPRHRRRSGRPGTSPPSEMLGPAISTPILGSDPRPVLLQPTAYDAAISTVQRNAELEEAQRLLAEDAGARVSALRKAKAAVLARLGREFCGRRGRPADTVAGREVVLEDRRAVESRSALVTLMLSRS